MPLTPHGRRAFLTIPDPVQLTAHSNGLHAGTRRTPTFPLNREPRQSRALKLPLALLPENVAAEHHQTLRQLTATGTVLVGAPIPGIPTIPAIPTDPFELEVASVHARRHAWQPTTDSTTVTALLCSNRPDRLPRAVEQMASQTHQNLEVVVVLHGVDHEPHKQALARMMPGRIKVLAAPAELPFGAALTHGARHADGTVVTKVDDDDLYGPHHITDLLSARAHSGAQLVGRALQYVHLEAINLTVRQDGTAVVSEPEAYGSWTCGGTITVDREHGNALGWYDPLPRAVDRNLQDKVLRAGGRVYRTHGLGYLYVRHGDGHTYGTSWAKYLRNAHTQLPGLWPSAEFGTTTLTPEGTR